jgi:hypothetical protein
MLRVASRKTTRAEKPADLEAVSVRKLNRLDAAPRTRRGAPYVQKVRSEGSLAIWIVDGAYVRKNIDREFCNFGHHYTFTKIPPREIWLDLETDPDEESFFIAHALTERSEMARGKKYEDALDVANARERRMRARAPDVRKVLRSRSVVDPAFVHVRLWKAMPGIVNVWYVEGRMVRGVFDIEFSGGGHDYVYEFVPRGEVWIDNDIGASETAYVLFHELHERNLMAKGMSYDDAHEDASRLEYYYRHHPNELHDALKKEGWE